MSYLLHLDLSNEELETFLFGYGGNVCQKCLQLVPSFVFLAWPDQHHTDISSALEVLGGELREDVADPVLCLRPAAQWPSCLRRRIAHATDGVSGTARSTQMLADLVS